MDTNEGNDEAEQLPAHLHGSEADSHRDASSSKRGWAKYAVGAALAYGVCVVLGGSMLSNEFGTIIELGFVMGLFLFVLLGPVHLLLQILAHWVMLWLWRPKRRIEATILNLPAAVLLAILLIGVATPPRPAALRESLKRHFGGRVPDSVNIKGYRMVRGLNDGSYTFVFSIGSSDLGSLLTNVGFVLDSANLEVARQSWYQKEAKELAKGTASIDMPCTVYLSETNRGISRTRKTLVVGSNGVDVVFCESFF